MILETLECVTSDDVVRVRQAARRHAVDLKFSLVEQTKIVTAASELARNMVEYGGGGTVTISRSEGRPGIVLEFVDKGPGIPDVERALADGFTSGKGLGLGLGGAKRLASEFQVKSAVGQGTTVRYIRWR